MNSLNFHSCKNMKSPSCERLKMSIDLKDELAEAGIKQHSVVVSVYDSA